jgi:hypothetical protein
MDEDSVEFVHENLKIALPESRVSGEIAHHMSLSAHKAYNDIRYWRGYKKIVKLFEVLFRLAHLNDHSI